MAENIFISKRNEVLGEKVVKNLQKRFFEAYYVENKEAALKKAIELIDKDKTVSWGGSVSAEEIGLIQYVIENGYNVIKRGEPCENRNHS